MKLNHNYNNETELDDWHPIVKKNFQAIEAHANSVDALIEKETQERQNADAEMRRQITEEKTAREGVDVELDGKISAKMTARSNADAALDGKITSEKNNRTNADNALQSAINTETDNRTQADEVLSQKIDDLKGSVITENKLTDLREEIYGRISHTVSISDMIFNGDEYEDAYGYYIGDVTSITDDVYDPDERQKRVSGNLRCPANIAEMIIIDGVTASLSAGLGNVKFDCNWEYGDFSLICTVDISRLSEGIAEVVGMEVTIAGTGAFNARLIHGSNNRPQYVIEIAEVHLPHEQADGIEDLATVTEGMCGLHPYGGRYKVEGEEIGDLLLLSTEDKSSVVAAVNETCGKLAGKVDKLSGKGLSANDYTTADKNKLAGIEENANNYTHPENHSASMIEESAERRFMTPAEKTKLAGVETEANNYTHPASHPAGMITTDSEHRFVTDAEKAAWNEFCAGNEDSALLMSALERISALEKAMKYIGEGTEFKPYLISTVADLEKIRSDLTACYRLTNDIEMSGTFEPIGSEETPFTGILDGAGYTIRNLKIDAPDNDCVGLFGVIGDGGMIKELSLSNNPETVIQGGSNVGAFAGINRGTLYKVNTFATTVHAKGNDFVGGLVGVNYGKIQYSYNRGKVTAASETGYAAGIAALNAEGGLIEECYSVATLTGNCAGGVAGINKGEIKRSHSTLEIVGDLDNSTGTADSTTTKESLKNMRGPESMTSVYADWSFGDVWNNITGSTQFPTHVKPNEEE